MTKTTLVKGLLRSGQLLFEVSKQATLLAVSNEADNYTVSLKVSKKRVILVKGLSTTRATHLKGFLETEHFSKWSFRSRELI